MAKVFDQKLADSMRLRALHELGEGSTFWYPHCDQYSGRRVVARDEQKTIVNRIVPMLRHETQQSKHKCGISVIGMLEFSMELTYAILCNIE